MQAGGAEVPLGAGQYPADADTSVTMFQVLLIDPSRVIMPKDITTKIPLLKFI
jgi:hypothetical protein